jgi:hypothetical protein
VEKGRRLLLALSALLPTVERLSLAGSAWKRLALIERLAGDAKAELACTVAMEAAYGDEVQLAETTNPDSWDRPAINQVAAQVRRCRLDRSPQALDASLVTRLRSVLAEHSRLDPDFWSESGLIEVDLYEHLVGRPGHHRWHPSPMLRRSASPDGGRCYASCSAPGSAAITGEAQLLAHRALIVLCSAPTPWRTANTSLSWSVPWAKGRAGHLVDEDIGDAMIEHAAADLRLPKDQSSRPRPNRMPASKFRAWGGRRGPAASGVRHLHPMPRLKVPAVAWNCSAGSCRLRNAAR